MGEKVVVVVSSIIVVEVEVSVVIDGSSNCTVSDVQDTKSKSTINFLIILTLTKRTIFITFIH